MKTKVCIVGFGFMGRMHSQAYLPLNHVELVGVVDGDAKKRKAFEGEFKGTGYGTLEEALSKEEIDIVDICLPTFMHRAFVINAAKEGKHVLCEKPIALNLQDADAMIAAVKRAKVKFMVAHVIRFWEEYVTIKKILDSEILGEVKVMHAQRLSSPPTWTWKGWVSKPELSGGAVIDLHIHDLDYLAWALGAPKSVTATGTETKGAIDRIMTLCEGHKNGAVSFAEGSLAMPAGFPFTMSLRTDCEDGAIEYNSRNSQTLTVYRNGKAEHPKVGKNAESRVSGAGNVSDLRGYYNEIKYFVDCVRMDKTPEVITPRDARFALKLALTAYESVKKKMPLKVR